MLQLFCTSKNVKRPKMCLNWLIKLNLELIFFVSVFKQPNHCYEWTESWPVLYWCKQWPKLQGRIGSDSCLEQSGFSAINYYRNMCGSLCMKRFMTPATPAILGPDFQRHINMQVIWLVGFTKAYVNFKNSTSAKVNVCKDILWILVGALLQIQALKHLCQSALRPHEVAVTKHTRLHDFL